MSTTKKIRNIRVVDETEDSVEINAVFDYGDLGVRSFTIRIPSKDRTVIVNELKEAYRAKKPIPAADRTTVPSENE